MILLVSAGGVAGSVEDFANAIAAEKVLASPVNDDMDMQQSIHAEDTLEE